MTSYRLDGIRFETGLPPLLFGAGGYLLRCPPDLQAINPAVWSVIAALGRRSYGSQLEEFDR